MKIFLLKETDPLQRYAGFSHVGTWSDGGLCPVCGHATERLTEPLQVHWEPGSTLLGDFSWCSYTAVVKPHVKGFFESRFPCRFGTTVVVPPREQFQRVVPFPYEGPPLHWLICEELVGLDVQRSGVRMLLDCPACNRAFYTFRMSGIVVDKRRWTGQPMFRVREFEPSAATYVMEEGRDQIEQQGFSNFGYIEAGFIA